MPRPGRFWRQRTDRGRCGSGSGCCGSVADDPKRRVPCPAWLSGKRCGVADFSGMARVRVSPGVGRRAALGNSERSTRRTPFERLLTETLNGCCRPQAALGDCTRKRSPVGSCLRYKESKGLVTERVACGTRLYGSNGNGLSMLRRGVCLLRASAPAQPLNTKRQRN